MSTNKNSDGYICPFIANDCIHSDASSMKSTIICNHCEIFLHDTNMVNNEEPLDVELKTPLIKLRN